MQVNGVTLPDIPDGMLAQYPYALITTRINTEASSDYGEPGTVREYRLFATKLEILFLPAEIARPLGAQGFEMLASFGAGVEYNYVPGDAGWTLFQEKSSPAYKLWGDDYIDNTDDFVAWANHDIFEAKSVNLNTGAYTTGVIYFPDSENDDRLSIARNMLIHFATQARRLSGSREALKPEQMLEKYKGVMDIGKLYQGTIEEASHDTVLLLKDGLFEECRSLTTVSFPAVRQVSENAFYMCIALTSVYLPVAQYLYAYAFMGCSALKKLDLPAVTSIQTGAFANCTGLEALILRSGTVCTLGANAFSNSAIASGTGYIYVPSTLVNSYKTATNWYAHANQIRAIEDYPEICGTTA